MYNVDMFEVDHRCVAQAFAQGMSYELCARRAASRPLMLFIRDMIPVNNTHGFKRELLDELTRYVLGISHGTLRHARTARARIAQHLTSDREKRNFALVLQAGIARAQDTQDIPDKSTPLELAFQVTTNTAVAEILSNILSDIKG